MKLFFVFNVFICSSLMYGMETTTSCFEGGSSASSSSSSLNSSHSSRNGSPDKTGPKIKITNSTGHLKAKITRTSSTPILIPILIQSEIRKATSLPMDEFTMGMCSEDKRKITKTPSLPLVHLAVEFVRYTPEQKYGKFVT